MSGLFISHSGKNNAAAEKVRNWLVDQGWRDVFLDLDPEAGLAPGQRWQEELKRAGERCAAVVVLVSPEWAASPWCRTEFLVAVQLGKKIFPVIVAPTPFQDLPVELVAHFQLADISEPAQEGTGFERLAFGLRRAGLDPSYFPWPPKNDPARSPFRGLAPLDVEDAAIFFGRDGAITRGMDALRRMREGAAERGMIIVGPSGSGKSSFLRAGLVARLQRDDDDFLALPVLRAKGSALSGGRGLRSILAEAGADAESALRSPEALAAALAALRAPVMDRLTRHAEAARTSYQGRPPTIVMSIDQHEELLDGGTESARLIDLLAQASAIDGNFLVLATIRSEQYGQWQTNSAASGLRLAPFDLPPTSLTAFGDIIRNPAALANPPVEVDPELVEALTLDLNRADALPLLAATLERLHAEGAPRRAMTLPDYRKLGGVDGAVRRAAEAALAAAATDSALPNDPAVLASLTRELFIPSLVSIDAIGGEPKRRIAAIDNLPPATRPLVRHFVTERLLTIGDDAKTVGGVVDVVHEAVFRCWPALAAWIAQERTVLVQFDSVVRAAREWDGNARAEIWLLHQDARLREAEALLARNSVASALSDLDRAYISACRGKENREVADERARLAREKRQIAATRRFQIAAGTLTVLALAIVVYGAWRALVIVQSENARASIILADLAEDAADDGQFARAARYALSASSGFDAPAIGFDPSAANRALTRALNANRETMRFGDRGEFLYQADYASSALIAAASKDGVVRVWNRRDGASLLTIDTQSEGVRTAQASPDARVLVTADQSGAVRFWNLATGASIGRLPDTFADLRSAYFSPDGAHVLVASGAAASIWHWRTGVRQRTLTGARNFVLEAVYSRDGRMVGLGGVDRTVRVYEASTGRPLHTFTSDRANVASIAFAPDGSRIAAAYVDGVIRVWPLVGASEPTVITAHEDAVSSVRYSPDGRWLASSAEDGSARLWDVVSGRQVAEYRSEAASLNSVAFSSDSARLLGAGGDGVTVEWAVPADIVHTSGFGIASVAPTFDGSGVLLGQADGRARIIGVSDGREMWASGDNRGTVMTAELSRDGRRVLTASTDSTAYVWDVATRETAYVLSGHAGSLTRAEYSPDETRIVTASVDGEARVWRAADGVLLLRLQHNQAGVFAATFSANGRIIATAGNDVVVRLWDASTGALAGELRGHEQLVNDVRFLPNGDVVTVSDDRTIRIWRGDGGALRQTVEGHTAAVTRIVVSPDGARIATSSADRTVRVWDIGNGVELFRFEGYSAPVRHLAYFGDGTRLVTTAGDRTVRVLNVAGDSAPTATNMESHALVERACTAPGSARRLSYDEWMTARQLMVGVPRDVCVGRRPLARIGELLGF